MLALLLLLLPGAGGTAGGDPAGPARRLTCAMDVHETGSAEALAGDGYVIPAQPAPAGQTLEVTVSLPPQWAFASCCHKIRVQTAAARAAARAAPVAVTWTLCTAELRHVTCWWQDGRDGGELTVTLEQCLQPEIGQVRYVLSVLGPGSHSPAVSRGTADVAALPPFSAPAAPAGGVGGTAPCIVSGGLDTAAAHRDPLRLGRVLSPAEATASSSISFMFSYIVSGNPTNDVIFQMELLPEPVSRQQLLNRLCLLPPPAVVRAPVTGPSTPFPQPPYEAPRDAPVSLAVSEPWSGCRTDEVEGDMVVVCEGGRSLRRADTWYTLLLKACPPHAALTTSHLNYTVEILMPGSRECTLGSRGDGTMSGGAMRRGNGWLVVVWTVLLLSYSTVLENTA